MLTRLSQKLPIVSVVPLIDVLLILLVFFMVTSTFLDLDMIPMSTTEKGGGAANVESGATVLMRLVPDGDLVVAGQRIPAPDMPGYFEGLGNVRLVLLPAPQAELQALVTVLNHATDAGLSDVQIVRFGAEE